MALSTLLIGIAILLALVSSLAAYYGLDKYRHQHAQVVSPRPVSVLVLGKRESGKTVLLASMWRELAFSGRAGIRMTTESEEDAAFLSRLCSEIENPRLALPQSTPLGETKEWNFVIQAMGKMGNYTEAFRFSYLDYPGELLDNVAQSHDLAPEFTRALERSDIIMGVLDGQKIARLMRGVPDDDFSTMLREFSYLLMSKSKKTLHIIITKWDLLKGLYELQEVIEKLKEENPFRYLLETPRLGGVRIIPISSLGLNGFVREDPVGQMHKTVGKTWQPAHVTSPLACAIPDVLATDVNTLRIVSDVRRRKLLVAISQVSDIFFWVTLTLGLAVTTPTAVVVSATKGIELKVSLNRLFEKLDGAIRHARSRGVPPRLDGTTALLRALTFLMSEIDVLEREIPEAGLRLDTAAAT